VLFVANGMTHLQATRVTESSAYTGLRLGVYVITLLVVIVGGRIVPAFTANALRRTGVAAQVRAYRWIERLSVPAILGVILCELLVPASMVSGLAAVVAASVLIIRISGWQSFRTFRDPLLWSLHVGYSWVPVGLGCLALSDLTAVIPRTTGIHALTAGAFGTMILAVMTRVGVGHTGRALVVPRGITTAYLLVTAGAVLRTVGPVLLPNIGLPVLVVSGVLWAAAFVLFTVVYWPVLTTPRVDGRPG
jgi:uncharacterized protein involved in response to NO